MKVALLGDIHANHLALRAVLSSATRHKVERLLITGDLVGYYYWAKEVLEMLQLWNFVVVRGNHEQMLADVRAEPQLLRGIEAKYGSGLRVALESLTEMDLQWLENLQHPLDLRLDNCRILLCHGAPWDLDQYVYPDASDSLFARCADSAHDVVVLGHTHYPFHRKIDATVVINPGSVGQPRNRKSGAHWALLDTRTHEIDHQIESYDASPVIAYAQSKQPTLPYLWEVLNRK